MYLLSSHENNLSALLSYQIPVWEIPDKAHMKLDLNYLTKKYFLEVAMTTMAT